MASIFFDIRIPFEKITDRSFIEQRVVEKNQHPVSHWRITKKSLDARKRPVFLLRIEVSSSEFVSDNSFISFPTLNEPERTVVIVGAGPAGYFAALECIQLGMKPIVLDRGKDVRSRRRDLKAIQQDGVVNPHSNYCFGEGGAGTYSDGKLYTRSHKRGKIKDILKILVDHGATSDILVDAHPHIGSNKLPKIVQTIRETIESKGGEVRFNQYVTDFTIEKNRMTSVITEEGERISGDAIILATGHSARDIFYLLDQKGVTIEAKDFALGVRIEHPQPLIDTLQYKQSPRHENLPASSYKLTCQVNGKGVFSFCMCPGGLIVPAATAPGEIVVNGMSLSRRDSPFANSGFVTSISMEEIGRIGFTGTFAGLDFQKQVEQQMFQVGDGSQKAPAQTAIDFVGNRESNSIGGTSYIPGVYSAPLHELLPNFITKRLQGALLQFGKIMKGYLSEEAVLVGTESRTSSPIRIPRDKETLMHTEIKAFFPCGEGAGYAGGILSAAIDGRRVAQAVSKYIFD